MVNALSNQTIIEGRNLTVNCIVTPGNPNSVTNWTKVDSQGFKQTGAVLELPNIQRASSGTYRCTATNKFSDGNMGIHSQTMVINVLCRCSQNLNIKSMLESKVMSVWRFSLYLIYGNTYM